MDKSLMPGDPSVIPSDPPPIDTLYEKMVQLISQYCNFYLILIIQDTSPDSNELNEQFGRTSNEGEFDELRVLDKMYKH